jgi:hypothetical protein
VPAQLHLHILSPPKKRKILCLTTSLIFPSAGTQYTPEKAVTTLVEVQTGYCTKVNESWIECKAIPVKKQRAMLKRVQAYQALGAKSGALDPWFKRGAKLFCLSEDIEKMVRQRASNKTVGDV